MNNLQTANSKPLTILVTGAKGQLGKKIIDNLSSDFVLVLTDSDDMDITNASQVEAVINREKPDFVIHGAAYTKVDQAEENVELCRKVNAFGSKNVAEAAQKNGATLIYISTDYVFDGKKKTPYSETDLANPLSVYGLTKFEGEEFVRQITAKHYIVRTAWVFGELPEGHPGTNYVETMLRLAKERDSLSVVNDQIGSPTYTGDLVNVLKELISKQPEFGTYHFSGDGECSWYDFAKEIFRQTKTKIDLKAIGSKDYPQKAKRPSYSYLDKSKIEAALGIKTRPWQEMLEEYLVHKKQ